MTTRQVALIGGGVGLVVSVAVLVLLFFGVWGILRIGNTDLLYILWPSSVMLTITWRSTVGGIMTTIASVVFNCLIYIAVALLLRAGIQWIGKRGKRQIQF